jgi:hypothetical protein
MRARTAALRALSWVMAMSFRRGPTRSRQDVSSQDRECRSGTRVTRTLVLVAAGQRGCLSARKRAGMRRHYRHHNAAR